MATVDRVRAVVEPLLSDLGLEVYDIEHQGGTLRILVDAEGGIALDALTTATRLVSRSLDEVDAVPGTYTLEVSSPGLERPLRTPAHFRGALGTPVAVKTVPTYEGDRRLRGVLTAADDEGCTVRTDEGTEVRLTYADVSSARTVFDWGPAPHPKRGKPRNPNQKARAR